MRDDKNDDPLTDESEMTDEDEAAVVFPPPARSMPAASWNA